MGSNSFANIVLALHRASSSIENTLIPVYSRLKISITLQMCSKPLISATNPSAVAWNVAGIQFESLLHVDCWGYLASLFRLILQTTMDLIYVLLF